MLILEFLRGTENPCVFHNLLMEFVFSCMEMSHVDQNVSDEHQELLARKVLEEMATVGTGADVPLDEYMYTSLFIQDIATICS